MQPIPIKQPPLKNFEECFHYARIWAGEQHAALAQTWAGGRPYLDHLDAVDGVLARFGYKNPKDVVHQILRFGAMAHDLIEDTKVTGERIRWYMGPDVERIVVAVTNEPGKNRAEKHLKTYPKIAADPLALVLKLADRIANVEVSVGGSTGHFEMYLKEHPGFRAALYTQGSPVEPMWQALDALLGFQAAPEPLEAIPGALLPTSESEVAPKPAPAVESAVEVESNVESVPWEVESGVESAAPVAAEPPAPVQAVPTPMELPEPPLAQVAVKQTPWF